MATYKDTLQPADELSVPQPPGRMGRRMNSQMNISLPIEMHEQLRELAWKHRMPLSHVCRELFEFALRTHEKYSRIESEPASE